VGSLARVQAIADKFAGKGVAYKLVYVTEAHPKDGWMNSFAPAQFKDVRYARSVEERLKTAGRFAELCDVDAADVIVDGLPDELERSYEARPERLYVVRGGNVLWRCGLGPFEYDPAGLEAFLAEQTR